MRPIELHTNPPKGFPCHTVPTAAETPPSKKKKPAAPADRKRLARTSTCATTPPPNPSPALAPMPTRAAANKKATALRRGQLQIANQKFLIRPLHPNVLIVHHALGIMSL